jgi:hypothetical protein
VRAVMRGSWQCVQVLGGRSKAGPWARADGAEVRRAEQRHAQEELRWKAVTRDAGTRRSCCWARRQGFRTLSSGCCNGMQGEHARCGRSCSATVVGGFAREQQGRVWRTSEAVEEKTTKGAALMRTDLDLCGSGRTVMARRAGGKVAKRRRRSERIWTSTSADASESVLPVVDSARFCRRVRMQSNGPCASKSEADGVEAERERQPCEWLCKYAGSARTGAVWSRSISSCASRDVRSARLWHRRCMGRGSSTREQENPRVRGEIGIANPFGSIVLSHDPRHPATSTLRHQQALLLANLVRHGNSFSVCSSPQPRFALIHRIFLMPAIPFLGYRR